MVIPAGITQPNEIGPKSLTNCTASPKLNQGVNGQLYSRKKRDNSDFIGDISPLDRKLKGTIFLSQKADTKLDINRSLRDFEKLIRKTTAPSKESCPWFKAARFGDEKTDKNCLRHDSNVLTIDGAEIDSDSGLMPMAEAAKRCKDKGMAALFYESASSTPEKQRYRGVFPCSKSLPADQREGLVAVINGVLERTIDPVSYNRSQSFYFGNVKDQPKRKTILVEGRYIDLTHDLKAGAIGRGESKPELVAGNGEADGSKALLAFAGDCKRGGKTYDQYVEALPEQCPDGWRHVQDQSNKKRAMQKVWDKVPPPVAVGDFDNEGIDPDAKQQGLNVTCFANIEPENINWVWYERLALGKITIFAGDPGQGKSQISLSIASTISNGGDWPDGGKAPKGHVIILSAEDGANDTTLPRLMALGANRQYVHAVRGVTDKGRDRSFSLSADLKKLDELCARLGNVVLVVIDPVTSYLGDIDSHRTSDVRAVLEPLGNWAEKAGVAVLAISHPPKAAQGKAVNAVTGSLAFVAAARIALMATADPETKGRSLLLSVKNNIAKAPKGLGYQIEGCTVAGPRWPIATSRIAWDDKEVKLTADEALNFSSYAGKPSESMDDAISFLRNRLSFGAVVPAMEMVEAAKAHCISEATLRRARKQLGVVADKSGYQGGWAWHIPDKEDVI